MGDLLEYVQTGQATGSLSRDIDALVKTFNQDRKWVSSVLTLEQDTAIRCRRIREEALAQGIEQGIEQGEERLGALVAQLLEAGRADEAACATTDADFREALYREFCL